jgi:hypothetical protein
MKTKEQIQKEIADDGQVMTIEEYIDGIDSSIISPSEGYGQFHDGDYLAMFYTYDIVSPQTLTYAQMNFPYVIWYEK